MIRLSVEQVKTLSSGDTGDDSLVGGNENDNLIGGEGSDSLAGGIGNDTLNGNSGNDSLLGGRDNDVVSGGQGNDVVYGNLGNDSVNGNLDNDVIIGTSGQIANPGLGELDTLSGGTGLDRFVLADSTALYYKGTGNQDFALITDFSFTEGDSLRDAFRRIELKSGINYQVAPVTVTSFPKGLGIFDGSDLIALVQNLTIADVTKLKGIFTLV
jgi:Ca2+-binding RTX toxin-like protein